MPTLSMFYGIIIRMQSEKGGKHHVPHIHCLYGDDEIVMSLDGEVLEGSIPANKLKLIVAWISLMKTSFGPTGSCSAKAKGTSRLSRFDNPLAAIKEVV